MEVFILDSLGNRKFVPGPADLTGKTGTIVVYGDASQMDKSVWSSAIGLFVMRGGDVAHS